MHVCMSSKAEIGDVKEAKKQSRVNTELGHGRSMAWRLLRQDQLVSIGAVRCCTMKKRAFVCIHFGRLS